MMDDINERFERLETLYGCVSWAVYEQLMKELVTHSTVGLEAQIKEANKWEDHDISKLLGAETQLTQAQEQIVALREALEVTQQALLEIKTARENGPGWFTKGVSGQQSHIEMWLRKGMTAARETLTTTEQAEVITQG